MTYKTTITTFIIFSLLNCHSSNLIYPSNKYFTASISECQESTLHDCKYLECDFQFLSHIFVSLTIAISGACCSIDEGLRTSSLIHYLLFFAVFALKQSS